ncbi:MAG: hypothetical protein MK135_10785 [Polyangiaceae bacterium]|nr:hypothetical protein [Polyangiaceae bacterium]
MCTPKTIAEVGGFRVERCSSCKLYSISIGPITIRLDDEAVSTLHGILGDVLAQVNSEEELSASPPITTAAQSKLN